jgi:hypothetical protein
MRQLSDILMDKKNEIGGFAKMARLIGGVTGQQIGQYAAGKIVPSVEFAVNWKRAFNENIIELMFEDDAGVNQVSEPANPYGDTECYKELAACRKDLIKCLQEKEATKEQLAELKNFISTTGAKP